MCLATVYVEDKELMRDVAWIERESDGLRLGGFLGESKLLQAKIKRVDLIHNAVVLEMEND